MLSGETRRLTEFSHGAGCGCKLGPGVLADVLAHRWPRRPPPELLVGTETGDDAAVWRLDADRALVATTDFFTPVVDDARTWGRIAAQNAVSDVYAMGGRPLFALNLVAWPARRELPASRCSPRCWPAARRSAPRAGSPWSAGTAWTTRSPSTGWRSSARCTRTGS